MISNRPFVQGGKPIWFEEEYRIQKFIGLYQRDPASGRKVRELEFIAVHGGQRIVAIDDIADIF